MLASFSSQVKIYFFALSIFSDTWSDTQVTVTSVLLVILNCGVFVYPVLSIIKDRIKPKKPMVENLKESQEVKPKFTSNSLH